MVKPRHAVLIAACAVTFLLSAVSFCLSIDAHEAFHDVFSEAEGAVGLAFRAVSEAEAAGANVSYLLFRLNEAAGLLSRAEMLYGLGDYDDALDAADRSLKMAGSVRDEALLLKRLAAEEKSRAFQFSLAFSIAGSAAFLLSLFLVWRWFRGFYIRRIMNLKPEVASDAEPR